mmetsp:Transcript_64832/g.150768  ORF Transcript_64832/g.150768 Transcript_64832/m.150768 type:complete len:116 (+) Transcript_64832:3-350(+)
MKCWQRLVCVFGCGLCVSDMCLGLVDLPFQITHMVIAAGLFMLPDWPILSFYIVLEFCPMCFLRATNPEVGYWQAPFLVGIFDALFLVLRGVQIWLLEEDEPEDEGSKKGAKKSK